MAIAVADVSRGGPRDLFTLKVVDSEAGSSRLRADGVLDWRGGEMLEALLIAQQESGMHYVRVDVSGVSAADRAGAAALLNAHERFLAARGTLMLIGVGPQLRGVLAAAELDRVLLTVGPPAPPDRSASRRTELAAS